MADERRATSNRLPTERKRPARHTRAVSSPVSGDSPTSPSSHRRSSFSSSDSRLARYPSRSGSKHKHHTLPSIRSLKSKFLGALGAGAGSGRKGPTVVKGEEARKPIRVVSASATVGGKPVGLKGFAGPAGVASNGITRSASTPVDLHSLTPYERQPLAHLPPPLPLSIDALLANEVAQERGGPQRSPPLKSPNRPKTADGSCPSRHERAASAPCGAPRASHREQKSRHSLSHPPLPPPAHPPVPPSSREPILSPISSDFSRSPAAPTLLALRQQQHRDSLDVERSLSRLSGGHRHSRILPSAALPADLRGGSALGRSKSLSAGLADAEAKRGRHWSTQPPQLHPPLPDPRRSSWQGQGSRDPSPAQEKPRPLLGRSRSAAAPQTASSSPSMWAESSPELQEGEREANRGKTLSALLGQARNGLGLGSSSPKEKKERDRRPSKPFPGGFEEVPYRPSIDSSFPLPDGAEDAISPRTTPPTVVDRPLSLPAGVQQQKLQAERRREFSFPETPPASVRLQHRKSDSSLATSSRRPSVAASTYRFPAPPLPLSSENHQQPESSAHLPADASLRKSKSAIDLYPPSPFLDAAAAQFSRPEIPLDQPAQTRTSVSPPSAASQLASRRPSEEERMPSPFLAAAASGYTEEEDGAEEEERRTSLSFTEGKTFAQVIEERTRGGTRPLDSPLGELIEELRSRQSSAAPSPRLGHRVRDEASSSGSEYGEGEDGSDVDIPQFDRKDSQGAANPFLLARYLDSPSGSPAVGRKGSQRPPLPTDSSSGFSPLPQPSFAPSTLSTDSTHDGSSTSAPAAPAPASPAGRSDASPDVDRTLTLDQMEREIARIEAELAHSGRPMSFYDDSTPKPADIEAFASPDAGSLGFASSLLGSGEQLPPGSLNSSLSSAFAASAGSKRSSGELGVPLPPSEPSTSEVGSPEPDDVDGVATAAGEGRTQITPRTARRWSILEIEKAYERMKRMLGSSAGAGGRPWTGLEDKTLEQKRQVEDEKGPEPGEAEEVEEVEDSRETNVESTVDKALDAAKGFTGIEEAEAPRDRRSSDLSDLDLKPLPGLPPPTPSPKAGRLTASASTAASTASTLPTSDPETAQTVSLKTSADSLAPPAPLSARAILSQREHNASPSLESLRFASSSGHKRKESEASVTSPNGAAMRKLVLPVTNQTRLRTKATAESLRSLYSPTTEEEPASDDVDSPAVGRAGRSTPLSPERRPRTRTSSRLSSSGLLRSGAGRALQGLTAAEAEEDSLFSTSTSTSASTTDRRQRARTESGLSVHRLLPPSSATLDASARDPLRRSAAARRSAPVSGGNSASWYPVTPSRDRFAASGGRMRTDSQSTTASARRRSREEEHDGESLVGGLEDSEMMQTAGLNIASIRGMDKLEIFFRYTAVRADLEKAELERDALFDALRETRATLSDIRRQRDALDAEVKRERLLTRQVKKHLGGDPDHYVDKLENLVQSRQTWEQRAKAALEELERAREEVDAIRREQEQLEQENLTLGARLASAGMRSESVASPTLRLPSSSASPSSPLHSLSLSSNGASPTPRSAHSSTSTSSDYHRSESPTLTMSRSPSDQTAFASTPVKTRSADLVRSHERHASKDSFASSTSGIGIGPSGLGEVLSPLMGQTMAFGPKSSYGSTPSPLKNRSSAAVAVVPPHRGQFSSLRLPFENMTTSSALDSRLRLSKHSITSSAATDEDDYADRSFESVSVSGLGRLRERDEAFLADLTGEIPAPAALSE
ncbi:hypothetical protein JCM10213_005761 [Rhodosporidiobolus nylandii]